MTLKVTAKGFELPDYMEAHIESEFAKFDKFQVTFHSRNVFMKLEPGRQFIVEIAVKTSVGDIEASADEKELSDALNAAFARLERQIIKKKEKPLAHRSELNERDKESFLKEEEASAEAAADAVIAENEK
ncbi:ribosome hibernation-promoting factor, HPF/YfiA family [Photobacterium toruni]|uniref:Ribosome-associated inhibitor A n=1 Tax=Photobacterium toruni TaxID=1935446 RepID=A0A1T4UTW4_9GAMM|nr:ribosome-associated translation inhibitor RaiA [Photobacterium toruni]MEC6814678.1 ribosome-associated translation inhibitor RaiA [Photobacterium toruni]MEC6832938.1 ribosome-associated translation inhibitor RaiA [Photobacterium toruni]SKA56110.1 Ribosome-associated inhibitor A [Photobacterium toruni]